MSALTKDNVDKLPSGMYCSQRSRPLDVDPSSHFAIIQRGLTVAVSAGHKTPSNHKPSLSRRSSASAGHGQGAGPLRDVDVTQIGVPVVTPRKERPGHKRSLTGKSLLLPLTPSKLHPTHPFVSTGRDPDYLGHSPFVPGGSADDLGSYFPSQPGATMENEWPIGDESTWKTAIKAQEIDAEDPQDVANTVVRHVTTTLARQAFNLDDVSGTFLPLTFPLSASTRTRGIVTALCPIGRARTDHLACGLPGDRVVCPGSAPQALE